MTGHTSGSALNISPGNHLNWVSHLNSTSQPNYTYSHVLSGNQLAQALALQDSWPHCTHKSMLPPCWLPPKEQLTSLEIWIVND